jgi:quercetin dioxygenase-like cupin family protein
MLESRPMNHRWLFFSVLVFPVFAVGQVLPPPTIEITAEPNHHLMLENQFVRVFKVELAPHAAMIVHNHRHDYFFTVLGESHIENDVVGKPPALRTFRNGETFFVLGDFAHTAKNLSDQTFRVVAVELMGNDKRKPSPKWDEERGLHILNDGTRDILFVKDGVRVSDLELQPGGVVPKHHHAGPHLVIAVTDLDLRSDVEGKGPSHVQLKAGEIAWAKGGATHTLTNIGKQNAKLITLEFP